MENKPASAELPLKKEVKSFIKRGSVIGIKHPMIFEPILNVIQKIEGSNIYFRLPDAFLKNNILKGEYIVCQLFQGDFEYVMDGMISSIETSYPRFVEVCIDKVRKIKNVRKNRRYLANFQANIQIPNTDTKVYAIIKNISRGGIAAILKEYIKPDMAVDVKVSISISKNEFLEFKARIVRMLSQNYYNEYGMQIISTDDINKNILDKLIYKLEDNESKFIEDYLK